VEVIPGRLSIEIGDISSAKTHAVVNAANTQLWMGSGVAGAIKKRGGDIIEKEALAQAPVRPGGTALTTGGNLYAYYVIHVATMEPGGPATERAVHSGTMGALALAKDNDIDSVAFPALGAGVGGLEVRDCMRVMLTAIGNWLKENSQPAEVVIVLFDEDSYNTCVKTWQQLKLDGEV